MPEATAYSPEQTAVFEQVAELVRGNMKLFTPSGKWLDEGANLESRLRSEELHKGRFVVRYNDERKLRRHERMLLIARRLLDGTTAWERLPRARRREYAPRILLVIWILTDSDADRPPIITAYQHWPWGELRDVATWGEVRNAVTRRRFTSDWAVELTGKRVQGAADLAQKAMRYAELPKETPKDGTEGKPVALTPNEQAVLDVLPEIDSPMIGRDVVAKLIQSGVRTIDEGKLCKMFKLPHMKLLVSNRRGAGYHKIPSSNPKAI